MVSAKKNDIGCCVRRGFHLRHLPSFPEFMSEFERKETEARLQTLEKEVEDYRQKLYQRFYSYKREAKLLPDRFYSLVGRHIDALEKEIISEVQPFVRHVDEGYCSHPSSGHAAATGSGGYGRGRQ